MKCSYIIKIKSFNSVNLLRHKLNENKKKNKIICFDKITTGERFIYQLTISDLIVFLCDVSGFQI